MYCVDDGRPNRAVQTVLGVHLLEEMFNLTDDEALEQLEFNLLWHHALRLDIEETHLPQKTLHNFRVRLMQHDGGRLAFQETTDRIIQALGIRTGKQRLDSTHARTGEGRRRLSVCARDLYRLVDRFHGTTAAQLEEYRLLERLLREQCHEVCKQSGGVRSL